MMFKSLFLKNKKNQEASEDGRSMVEMLGVLAIIGVLSIGGIAGYTMAMNRYRANEIINAASKVSILAISRDSYGASMEEVIQSNNLFGVTYMIGQPDGSVYFGGLITEGVYESLKSIGGNKFIDNPDSPLSSLLLNFARD